MSIQVTTTTDSNENVLNAIGGKEEITPKEESTEVLTAKEIEAEKLLGESENLETKEDDIKKDDEENLDDIEKEIEPPKKKSGFQKRINKLNSRITAKEQELEYWKEQALKSGKPQEKEVVQETIETNERPSLDDYEDHEDYIEALTDWKLDAKLKSRDEKNSQTKMKTEQQSQVQSFQDKNKVFADTKEDYEETLNDVDHIKMSLTVQQVIVESDNGPELMYELAKNSEEYERICALPPIKAAQALGRFENKYLKSSTKETKEIKTSKAPAPISTIKGKGASSSGKSIHDKDISQKDFERMRNEQEANRYN